MWIQFVSSGNLTWCFIFFSKFWLTCTQMPRYISISFWLENCLNWFENAYFNFTWIIEIIGVDRTKLVDKPFVS